VMFWPVSPCGTNGLSNRLGSSTCHVNRALNWENFWSGRPGSNRHDQLGRRTGGFVSFDDESPGESTFSLPTTNRHKPPVSDQLWSVCGLLPSTRHLPGLVLTLSSR
jgi:hypothetical protein